MAESSVVVFSGGAPPYRGVAAVLPPDAYVIAADRGFRHARDLGVPVHGLIGDFDSLAATDLAAARSSAVNVIGYPAEKDATDLELALDLAIGRDPRKIIVVAGGEGDRIDHFVTSVSLLCSPRYATAEVSAWFGRARLVVVRPGRRAHFERCSPDTASEGTAPDTASEGTVPDTVRGITGPSNSELITLEPITDEVHGVTTTGLKFALSDATLHRHRTRGVSNVFVSSSASVHITGGTLLVIQPSAITSGNTDQASS